MTQRIYVDISSKRVQDFLTGTPHIGKSELDLDILYQVINEYQCRSATNKGGIQGDEDAHEQEDASVRLSKQTNGFGDDKQRSKKSDLLQGIMQDCQIVRRERDADDPSSNLTEIECMRLRQEERAYQRSVANVTVQGHQTARRDIRAASEGIATAGHFVLSFVGAFLCGFYICELFIVDEIALKATVGGICSFATLLLEAALLLVREQRQEKRRKTEERRRACEAIPVKSKKQEQKPRIKPADEQAGHGIAEAEESSTSTMMSEAQDEQKENEASVMNARRRIQKGVHIGGRTEDEEEGVAS
ncbi:unnamed protein product [Amoebophrya sp. A25]|nr:unnamed protein product [Amoebophrya sp. A25]|eukprot:GSA25T00007839001.1